MFAEAPLRNSQGGNLVGKGEVIKSPIPKPTSPCPSSEQVERKIDGDQQY